MAPNTRVPEPERHVMAKNSNSTTILPRGTVESRGMGTNAKSRDAVSQEIREFIDGEGNSIWAEIRSFFTVWLFVTRLPSPSWVDAHPGEIKWDLFLVLSFKHFQLKIDNYSLKYSIFCVALNIA